MTKKEAAKEAAKENKARTRPLPAGKRQMRLGMGKRLYCLIRRTKDGGTARYWVARYTAADTGKVREKSLGLVEHSTLEAARKRVLKEIAQPLHEGVPDPVAAAKAAKEAARAAPTFAEVYTAYVAAHRGAWTNAKTVAQWQDALTEFCKPIADKPVGEVGVDAVLACLEPRWHDIPITMSRVRTFIERVLGYAMARKLRPVEINPAAWGGGLKHLLGSPTRLNKLKARHFPALPYAQVADLMAKLAAKPGTVALGLRFAILTAARSGEARLVRWDEIDLAGGLWTVPAERMKGRRPHVVPLSPQACDVLREAERHRCGPFVFVGDVMAADDWRHPISDASMLMSLRTHHPTATVHGMRSAFKDWATEETEFPNDLSEIALAHKVGSDVELAYRRGSMKRKRMDLMTAWANFIAPYPADAGNVVRLDSVRP